MILAICCKVNPWAPGDISPVRTTNETPSYTVYVDDNFHFMDEDERYTLGTYEKLGEALHKCMEMVGLYMLEQDYPSMKGEDLYDSYTSFGEDPFIIGPMPIEFSSWDYAESLANYLAGTPANEGAQAERRFRIANLGALILEARNKGVRS